MDAADVLGEALGEMLGASDVAFLIADFTGDAVMRLRHDDAGVPTRTHGRESAYRVELDGTPHGRALATQTVQVEPTGDTCLVIAPVTNRGEAIGVLELTLPEAPDDSTIADIGVAAHTLAYIVIANRRFTDLFEWGQRSVPLSLAAEIQHRLLPSAHTCEAGQFTFAAWLEPAGDIAGDTFDFAVERDTLHVSMTDAMGHAVEAAVLATVLVSALRNARRVGADLAAQAHAANEALAKHVRRNEFVTGQVARVDLTTGRATIVNAGHPPPLRLRDGKVTRVPLQADLPFGTSTTRPYRVQALPIQPGDRLLFVTDGVLERNAARLPIERLFAQTAGKHPRVAVQELVHALLEATRGRLKDDATVMCLDWHDHEGGGRTSAFGSTRRD